MVKKIHPKDLSEKELNQLLMEKRLDSRRRRLDKFRRSGRLVNLTTIQDAKPKNSLAGISLTEIGQFASQDIHLKRRKHAINRVLLITEIIAVLGLILVLFNGVNLIQRLNEEITAAFILPTLTPTPLIRAVVLPGGHTPPTVPGGARFNEAEIPEHLRPLQQAFNNIPLPTPSPEQAIRMAIPALGIDAPIVQGTGWEQLKQGIGQHIGSADPGQVGNAVYTAHNDVFGELFRYLDKLNPGDEIIVYSNYRSYTYTVKDTLIVKPSEIWVMDPTPTSIATLISCYPYLVNTERIIIRADLVEG